METPADKYRHPRPAAERSPGGSGSAGTRGTGARSAAARGTPPHGTAPHGTAPHGTAPHGTAPHGTAPHGTAARGTAARGTAANPHAVVLGSLTIPGRPEQVGLARAFVARTLRANQVGADPDAATLLTSEIVTNAIQHTKSGVDGGTVTIVVIGVSRGVLVEIIDDGSAGTPVVKGDLYAAEGHGLFLVQHLASQWGYLRDSSGTTVWFHLPASYEPHQAAGQPGPSAGRDLEIPAQPTEFPPDTAPYRTRTTHLWAAAIPPAAAPA